MVTELDRSLAKAWVRIGAIAMKAITKPETGRIAGADCAERSGLQLLLKGAQRRSPDITAKTTLNGQFLMKPLLLTSAALCLAAGSAIMASGKTGTLEAYANLAVADRCCPAIVRPIS